MLRMLQPSTYYLAIALHKNGHRKKDVNEHKIKANSKANMEHLIKHPSARFHVSLPTKTLVIYCRIF